MQTESRLEDLLQSNFTHLISFVQDACLGILGDKSMLRCVHIRMIWRMIEQHTSAVVLFSVIYV